MTKKIDFSKLEKVTQEDYEVNLSEQIFNAKSILDELMDIYNRYNMIDKDNYRLEFYRNNRTGLYLYTKDKKKKIGFEQHENTK